MGMNPCQHVQQVQQMQQVQQGSGGEALLQERTVTEEELFQKALGEAVTAKMAEMTAAAVTAAPMEESHP